MFFIWRCRVNINQSLLEHAIINLIDNAIKYSPKKTKVRIDASLTNSFVSIIITDEGCGIPEEDLPRIFERFYRVDKSRSKELGGTGLGLAIVKHIINIHKGTVEVESEFHKGSRFIIMIPAEL